MEGKASSRAPRARSGAAAPAGSRVTEPGVRGRTRGGAFPAPETRRLLPSLKAAARGGCGGCGPEVRSRAWQEAAAGGWDPLPADGPGRPERVARAAPAFLGADRGRRGGEEGGRGRASAPGTGRRGRLGPESLGGGGRPRTAAASSPRSAATPGPGERARGREASAQSWREPPPPAVPRPCRPTRWCRFAWRTAATR